MKARFLTLCLVLGALLMLLAEGCGSDGDPAPFKSTTGKRDGGSSGGGDDGQICLLNNCTDDTDCRDCDGERKTCDKAEKRCIACGPNAGNKSCKPGYYCTKYGDCSANSVKCDEDANGVPTIVCQNTADCGACGPKFKVCDTSTNRCVGCTTDNTSNCQSTDVCKNDTCSPKCPKSCQADDDCGECGATGHEAHACNKHICAQCSPTTPCPDGGKCDFDHGTCIAPCGVPVQNASNSSCTMDGQCSGCTGNTKCKLPVNGGAGVCAVPAPGCSEVGHVALPDPFNKFTNLCSTDNDCSNVSADLNVGKILRDMTGLGVIKDANLSYAMHACASVEVLDRSCGVCVPCKQDIDCSDIDITKVAGDMFGVLGSIGSRILLDKVFGPNDHKVHMFCQSVAGDYGVCLPCPNMLDRCAQTNDAVPPSGSCGHGVCQPGERLGIQCEAPCVAEVCAKDPYCCIKEWDYQCKTDVDLYCKGRTCEPDKCIYRDAGWYCFDDKTQGGYLCNGEPGVEQIAEGHQCASGRGCKRTGSGPKDPAELCTTESEGDPECPIGSKGKPKCVKL
jgi:hypothetical protein